MVVIRRAVLVASAAVLLEALDRPPGGFEWPGPRIRYSGLVKVGVTRASARTTGGVKGLALVVEGLLAGDEPGRVRRESLHYRPVVSNGHQGFSKEKTCHFASAEG